MHLDLPTLDWLRVLLMHNLLLLAYLGHFQIWWDTFTAGRIHGPTYLCILGFSYLVFLAFSCPVFSASPLGTLGYWTVWTPSSDATEWSDAAWHHQTDQHPPDGARSTFKGPSSDSWNELRPERPTTTMTLDWRVLAVLTRSAVTPPEVNRFWWNLEHAEYIVGGWPWHILGAIRAVATGEIFLLGKQRMISPISRRPNFTKIEHDTRPSVSWWKLSEQNFENFTVRGRFSEKATISQTFLTSCDFRPPELRNDYRSPEIH